MRRVFKAAVTLAMPGNIGGCGLADRCRRRTPQFAAISVAHVKYFAGRIADRIVRPRRQLVLAAVDRPGVSAAFSRRLEAKTQVFTMRFSDHFRNRLTHTIEVAQIKPLVVDVTQELADLRRDGYRVEVASDGEMALEMARRALPELVQQFLTASAAGAESQLVRGADLSEVHGRHFSTWIVPAECGDFGNLSRRP